MSTFSVLWRCLEHSIGLSMCGGCTDYSDGPNPSTHSQEREGGGESFSEINGDFEGGWSLEFFWVAGVIVIICGCVRSFLCHTVNLVGLEKQSAQSPSPATAHSTK